MGAPRQTRLNKIKIRATGKWVKSPVVERYRAFRDEVRVAAHPHRSLIEACSGLQIVAYMRIPPSWSNKKQMDLRGAPCLAKPDIDNIGKAVLDALFEEDKGVWRMVAEKRWDDGRGPRLEITLLF